jgi:hypothetical protein
MKKNEGRTLLFSLLAVVIMLLTLWLNARGENIRTDESGNQACAGVDVTDGTTIKMLRIAGNMLMTYIPPLESIPVHGAINVSNVSPTKIPDSPSSPRDVILIVNMDPTDTVYIGSSSVTTSNGWPLSPYGQGNDRIKLAYSESVDWYGISDGDGATVRYMEMAQ